jgi:GNAT superfamily N-acetyltransferase
MAEGIELALEDVTEEDLGTIVEGLGASNLRSAELRPEWAWQQLAVVARRENKVVGGAVGRTGWAWLFVGRLWVADELRGDGLGTPLMSTIEDAARERGCVGSWLDTFSFQARPFYERLGYEVFGELDDFPPGHARYFMKKRWEARGAQPAGG